MPAHDWTRVDDGIFHDFHSAWMGELRKVLNGGLLPKGYYALADQVAGGIGPDVMTLQIPTADSVEDFEQPDGAVAVAVEPPQVQTVMRSDTEVYAAKQRSLLIRHTSNHRLVAIIELVSPGNKSNRHGILAFLQKVIGALVQRIHVSFVDLFPPGPRDPQGIHGLLWEELIGNEYEHPGDKPLSVVAYSAGLTKTAYLEPFAVGDSLPEMPLFLTEEAYIKVPLEETYSAAYAPVPEFYRDILEGEAGAE